MDILPRLATLMLVCGLTPIDGYSPTPAIEHGVASQYALAPTVGTFEYRYKNGDLTDEDVLYAEVYIATAQCERIGERGYINIESNGWMPYVVFDCAGHADTYDWMMAFNVVEIDFWTAQRLDLVCLCGLDMRIRKLT